jgi:hypothetical protein
LTPFVYFCHLLKELTHDIEMNQEAL